jgi:hypothetical protein
MLTRRDTFPCKHYTTELKALWAGRIVSKRVSATYAVATAGVAEAAGSAARQSRVHAPSAPYVYVSIITTL